ncbi:hypothetical protein AB0D11_31055 [Streptomyces monashensis]
MIDLHSALWGLLGSSVAEALNLSALMRPTVHATDGAGRGATAPIAR